MWKPKKECHHPTAMARFSWPSPKPSLGQPHQWRGEPSQPQHLGWLEAAADVHLGVQNILDTWSMTSVAEKGGEIDWNRVIDGNRGWTCWCCAKWSQVDPNGNFLSRSNWGIAWSKKRSNYNNWPWKWPQSESWLRLGHATAEPAQLGMRPWHGRGKRTASFSSRASHT